MVGWGGGIPRFTEFDDQGNTTFEARFLTPGAESYRAYRMPWSVAAVQRRGPHSFEIWGDAYAIAPGASRPAMAVAAP